MEYPRLEYALVSLFLLTALSARYYPVYTHWLMVGGAMAALLVMSTAALILTFRKAPASIFRAFLKSGVK